MRALFSIYKLYDPREPDEARYVGLTKVTLQRRLTAHTSPSHLRDNTYKNNWIKKCLLETTRPEICLIEVCTNRRQACAREKFWISYYRNLGHRLTNLTDGGDGMFGHKPSAETVAKRKKANAGFTHTPETKEKIRQIKLGTKASHETRMKMSKVRTGKKQTAATKAKIGFAHRAENLSPETLAKFSAARKGKPLKPVNISAAIEVTTSPRVLAMSRAKGGRAVIDQYGRVYMTQAEVAKAHNIDPMSVSDYLRGKSFSCRGLILRYIDDPIETEPNEDP